MNSIQIKPLTYENFQKYGDFVRLDQVSPEKYQRIGQHRLSSIPT